LEHGDVKVKHLEEGEMSRNWLASVLTDIHFWVPVVVLLGGLLLLGAIR
jgi:hypothetical protein